MTERPPSQCVGKGEIMQATLLDRMVNVTVFHKSPVGVYLRFWHWLWDHLPPSLTTLSVIRLHGNFLQTLVRMRAKRHQYFGTFFLRNRPQLELIRRLAAHEFTHSPLRISVLGSSNGAEVYSILWTIRSRHPHLQVILNALDISPEILALAQKGTYPLTIPELVNEPILERMTKDEVAQMFDLEDNTVTIKPWIKEDIQWHLGDAADPNILSRLGPQDIVVANNFMCHMYPQDAERCLRNIARLVSPGGYLFVSGIDLDIRTKVARDLGWVPVRDLIEPIHDGDPRVRADWPFEYWGLEPLTRNRHDWQVRYASAFQLGRKTSSRHLGTLKGTALPPWPFRLLSVRRIHGETQQP